jgi:hypothetical protein
MNREKQESNFISRKEELATKNKWWQQRRVGLIDWEKRHPKATPLISWISIIALSIVMSIDIYLFSILFGFIILLSADAWKTLIEAEATILGFFGLIAVYALTSYDNRIDKVEEKILDSESDIDVDLFSLDYFKREIREIRLHSLKRKIRERKRRTVMGILSALISIILSFFLSITVLGLVNINPQMVFAYQLSFVASTFLFIGIFAIFMMLYRMGREPEDI